MTTLFIIFMILAGIICVFTASAVAVDMVHDYQDRKAQKSLPQEETPQPLPPTPPIEEEPVVEEVAVAEEVPVEEMPAGIWFKAKKTQTLEEKYLALADEKKAWYDEIQHYAMSQANIKHYRNDRHEDYKVGLQRIVRLTVKRGVVQCEFVLINQDFRNYINENKVTVKTAPTVIKIENAEGVTAAKNSIDIAMKAVEDARQYRKEKQRERRRQARAANRQETHS